MAYSVPKHLGKLAADKYLKIVRANSNQQLSTAQKILVEQMAECYETAHSAGQELQRYAELHNSLSVPGAAGQLTQHPALRTQLNAMAAYRDAFRQLRMSLDKSGSKEEQPIKGIDSLEAFMEGDGE